MNIMRFKKAFTIAEIAVAMCVLGGIAALLMPVLYNDTEDKVLETALNKTYSTFQQTARSIGLLISRGRIAPGSTPTFTFFQALTETAKTIDDMNLSDVDGQNLAANNNANVQSKMDAYLAGYDPDNAVTGIVPSGAFVMYDAPPGADEYIVIDVNGRKKPNVVGRDIFYFTVERSDSSSYSVRPPRVGNCNEASNALVDRLGCTRQSLKIRL